MKLLRAFRGARLRRTVLAGLFAVVAGAGGAATGILPAGAATVPAARSAPVRAEALTATINPYALAATRPGAGPAASVTPDSTDSHGCPSGDFCAWPASNYSATNCPGVALPESEAPGWFNWAEYSADYCSGDPGTWSWDNNTKYRVWKQQTDPPNNNNWCISPGDSNPHVSDNVSREDGLIQVTTNTAAC